MSLIKSWYTVDEAAAKYGLSPSQIYAWVEDGLVRAEGEKGMISQVNGDDIERELLMTASV